MPGVRLTDILVIRILVHTRFPLRADGHGEQVLRFAHDFGLLFCFVRLDEIMKFWERSS